MNNDQPPTTICNTTTLTKMGDTTVDSPTLRKCLNNIPSDTKTLNTLYMEQRQGKPYGRNPGIIPPMRNGTTKSFKTPKTHMGQHRYVAQPTWNYPTRYHVPQLRLQEKSHFTAQACNYPTAATFKIPEPRPPKIRLTTPSTCSYPTTTTFHIPEARPEVYSEGQVETDRKTQLRRKLDDLARDYNYLQKQLFTNKNWKIMFCLKTREKINEIDVLDMSFKQKFTTDVTSQWFDTAYAYFEDTQKKLRSDTGHALREIFNKFMAINQQRQYICSFNSSEVEKGDDLLAKMEAKFGEMEEVARILTDLTTPKCR